MKSPLSHFISPILILSLCILSILSTGVISPDNVNAFGSLTENGTAAFMGIGINPTKILHVSGTGPGTAPLFARGTDSAGFIIERTPSNRWVVGVNENPTLGNGFVLSTFPTGSGSSVPRLLATQDGRVGIGTTAPLERLDVDGNIRSVLSATNLPTRTGVVTLNAGFYSSHIAVSGRYAYVATNIYPVMVDVVDISNPASPTKVGAVTLNEGIALDMAVSGKYAYFSLATDPAMVVVVDISNPSSPTRVGAVTLNEGEPMGFGMAVSGRYAYVSTFTRPARVVALDISNPAAPSRVGAVTLNAGENDSLSIAVSGRYAYVITDTSPARVVAVDISNPESPARVGAVTLDAGEARGLSIAVSGRYAYITTATPVRMVAVDIRGAEISSLMAHSLEAGSLQVRKDVTVYDHLNVGGGVNIGQGGVYSAGDIASRGGAYFGGRVGIGTTSPPNSLVQVNGSIATAYKSITDNYTATEFDSIIAVYASDNTVYVNLPTASGIQGRQYTIKRVDATPSVVLDCYGDERVDGNLTYDLTGIWKYVTVVSNGNNWLIIADN